MCCANKLTGQMELVLLLNERTSLFSHGTFQRYTFALSARSGYDEHACETIFFPNKICEF